MTVTLLWKIWAPGGPNAATAHPCWTQSGSTGRQGCYRETGGHRCWEHWEHSETVVLGTLGDDGAIGTLGDSGAGNTWRQWCWKHWETVVLETLGDSGAGNTGNTEGQWCWEHWETVGLGTLGDSVFTT